ncbi:MULTISPECIES: PKD domain-containing protein [unclassified Methanoregula]|uniref:PKD domain-containing protein n=1 Tax=unclassified Methanoregula TaxID=2649730 RepID=UPI0009D3CCEB|nr:MULTISPECIES: PKD domain-containing protein [unclassified Methanoregula]OPX65548.1 MAG: PKD domain protein [Methanoregula sp. PtaB.Bin085]OPY35827.1 MAG: PKD domain protein [Methanoregula sp. PtaU1.Bin006]
MKSKSRSSLPVYALVLFLFLSCAGPGVAAADATQPGYIVVGVVPVAQFDAYYAFSTVPTKVSFVDHSLGSTPMSWQWDFGDGSNSTEQNPEHTYLRRGTYTVSLTATNAYGTSTATKKNYITIGMEPKADFSASPLTGDSPLTVKFTDKSLGQVTQWQWDFGDGKGSSDQSPAHTYWSGGTYNVILTVSNDYGSSDITKTGYITVIGDLKSAFTADPASGKAPLTVRFTDRSIGSPTAWAWDFGDGTNSTDQNPVHVFTRTGTFDVTLTVTRGGIGDKSSQTLNVGDVPVADFNSSTRSGNVGQQIRFTDTTANNPTEWWWDFGDTATSDARNPSHAYQLKGIYTVTLTAKNANGADAERKQDYINIGIAPVADFVPVIIPYQKNTIPLQVQFVDQSMNVPTSWTWDFGDGQISNEQNPRHSYVNEGTYTVRLTVKNTFGEDTKVQNGLIEVSRSPAVDFVADKTTVGVGGRVTFSDLSSNSPTSWVWDFGDGSTGTGPNPDHVYRTTGVYDVTLTASNPDLTNSRTRNKYITVINIPRAGFTADRTQGGTPLGVQFLDQSAGAPTSWQWDFGDGTTSMETSPSHQYTAPGSFTVTLKVSNANGQDTTVKKDYIVTTPAPVADFRADRQAGKAPFVVRFTDLSKGSPTAWLWDFGDGTGSKEQNPSHIYMNEGTYVVKLTVSNQYGSDSIVMTGNKSAASPASGTIPSPVAESTGTVPTEQTQRPVTQSPSATRSPLSPCVVIIAAMAGLLGAARAGRE